MFIHPETARLLARAKIEEAESRMPPVAAIRAASLERQDDPAPAHPTTTANRPSWRRHGYGLRWASVHLAAPKTPRR